MTLAIPRSNPSEGFGEPPKFHIQHSVGDLLVPYQKSVDFVNLVGSANASLFTFNNSAHEYKGYTGADRTTSIDNLVNFFRNACGYK